MARRGTSADPIVTRDKAPDVSARKARVAAAKARGEAPRSGDSFDIVDEIDRAYEDGRTKGRRERQRDAPSRVAGGAAKLRAPSGVGRVGDSTGVYDDASNAGSNARAARRGALAPIWAPLTVEMGVITARSIIRAKRAPLPSELGAAVFIFGLLALPGGDWGDVGAMVAWGLVLATIYGTVAADPSLPGKVGNAISGQQPTVAPKPAAPTAPTHNKR